MGNHEPMYLQNCGWEGYNLLLNWIALLLQFSPGIRIPALYYPTDPSQPLAPPTPHRNGKTGGDNISLNNYSVALSMHFCSQSSDFLDFCKDKYDFF